MTEDENLRHLFLKYDQYYDEVIQYLFETYAGKEAIYTGYGKFKGRKVTILNNFLVQPLNSWSRKTTEDAIACLVGFHRKDGKDGYITEDPYDRTYYKLSQLEMI